MKGNKRMINVFIIGSKGIPAKYGGFETFVDKLTEYRKDKNIKYHIACLAKDSNEFEYNGARCFNINVHNIGSAKAVYYDIAAIRACIKYIKSKNIKSFVIYILACRIGPFIKHYKKIIYALGGHIYVNPDGHEFLRGKWIIPIKKYWKYSERLMVRNADLLICDSMNILKYICDDYKRYNPSTAFIAYGAETNRSKLTDEDPQLLSWFTEHDIKPKEYYLIVGRFVPENNYETIIREFIKSKTDKDLIIITNTGEKHYYNRLISITHFNNDSRIKFVGTVYNKELLKKIRENAYAYIHGHEVGGTNPSLLEALSSTSLNLLLNVGFNFEVAEESAIYWSKANDNLSSIINSVEHIGKKDIEDYGKKAMKRITDNYSWTHIIDQYENIFRCIC
jgi:rhamnosyltransferase